MRKPRDFDSELQALTEKAKQLKGRKVLQLGELVIATGADALDPETLTGALPSGEDGLGREKRNRRPGTGQRATPATRGRLFPLWERKGKALGVPTQQTKGGD